LLKDLLRRLQSALSPVPPEESQRYRRIDDWIAGLPPDEARHLACHVLENPDWFRTQLGDGSRALPVNAAPTVREFYGRYVSATGRFCDMHLIASGCGESGVRPELSRVGRYDAYVELCTQGTQDRVLLVATDVASKEAIEGSAPSIYHAVVRMAAVLEYVPVPAA
jgi:hypothetical protein